MDIKDNGTLITLGLVGVVAAVGAASKAGLYGSRAEVGNQIMVRREVLYLLSEGGFDVDDEDLVGLAEKLGRDIEAPLRTEVVDRAMAAAEENLENAENLALRNYYRQVIATIRQLRPS